MNKPADSSEILDMQSNTMSLGDRLRKAREERKLSLEQVAERLRLSKTQVAAIENNDYSYVSAVAYARGHVRMYAQMVGLSANEIVRTFDDTIGDAIPVATDTSIKVSPKITAVRASGIRRGHWHLLASILAVLIVISLVMIGYQHGHRIKEMREVSRAPTMSEPSSIMPTVAPAPVRPMGPGNTSLAIPKKPSNIAAPTEQPDLSPVFQPGARENPREE